MKRLIPTFTAVAALLGVLVTLLTPVPAHAATTDCRAYNRATQYVICVDVSAQVGSVRSAKNGVIGNKVVPTFTVTTSRTDSDGPNKNGDTITRQGQFIAYNAQVKTSSGLQNYIQFGSGQQGVHYYSKVGAGYDSHGCVRVGRTASDAMWSLLVTGPAGNLVKKGVVEVHVYP